MYFQTFSIYFSLCFGKGIIKVITDFTALFEVLRYFQKNIALLLQLGAKKDQDFMYCLFHKVLTCRTEQFPLKTMVLPY